MSTSNSSSGNTSGGIGLTGVVSVVFLVLKLVGVIDWSWWWVTAPLWGSALLALAILAVVLVGALIAAAVKR
jgi:hypothetical protein